MGGPGLEGRVNFVDYAYVPNRSFEMLIECDGFGPHWRDISRRDFDRNSERQNLLLLDDWKLLRFTYDGIKEQSSRCQQTVLYALAKWGQMYSAGPVPLSIYERAILHYLHSFRGDWASPGLLGRELKVTLNTLSPHLQTLLDKEIITANCSPTGKKMGNRLKLPGKWEDVQK